MRHARAALGAALVVGWVGGVIGAGQAGVAGASGCTTTGTTVTCTYVYSGGQQTFTVPLGVTSVTVAAVGAAGAPLTASLPNHGGVGATARAAVTVTPGATLYVEVGGAGHPSTTGSAGGWNGGGAGGAAGSGGNANGGGGASDVRTVQCSATCAAGGTSSSLASRVVVAGGGGGGGQVAPYISALGSTGGAAGSPGTNGTADAHNDSGGTGGGAATGASAGAGGTAGVHVASLSGSNGTPGQPGAFGRGGTGGRFDADGGGGGGGGATSTTAGSPKTSGGGGGGGGSSYAPGGTTGLAASLTTPPSVTISYTLPTAVTLYVRTSSSGTTCTTPATGSAGADACGQVQTAVTKAEGASGTVVITVGPGTYSGGITVAASGLSSLTIKGAGASSTTVTGHGSTRDFSVSSGSVKITGLDVANGDPNTGNQATTLGGGVYVAGGATATLSNDVFHGDTAEFGGGVSDYGTVTATHDTFSTDHATDNGGGFTNSYATATLTDDTFTGDSAASVGGGVGNWGAGTVTHDTFSGDSAGVGGGLANDSATGSGHATVTAADDTFAGDSATSGAAVFNGGALSGGNVSSTANVVYDTFFGNSATVVGGGIDNTPTGATTITASLFEASTCSGAFTPNGNFNVATTSTCAVGTTSKVSATLGVTTTLASTTAYPAHPATLALLAGSPALDAVACTGLPGTDERGAPRPSSGKVCDAGAYQLLKPIITSPVTGAAEPTPTITVRGTAAPGATVTVTASGTPANTSSPTTADSSGNWTARITALYGTDTLVASVKAPHGKQSSDPVAIDVTGNTLVVNGGFETPVVGGSTHLTRTPVPGWTPTSTTCGVELQSKALLTVAPYTGTQYAALAPTCPGGAVQAVATVPGQEYWLSFAYRAGPGTHATANRMTVEWRTAPITWGTGTGTFTTLQATTTGPSNGWTVAHEIVTATSATTKLQFDDISSPASAGGDLLDGVSLLPFYPAKAKNVTWQHALTEPAPSTTANKATRVVAFSTEFLWYKFPVEPDQQVSVQLSDVPANYELLLFSDITAAYQADKAAGSVNLTELAAQNAAGPNAAEFSPAGGAIGPAGGAIGPAGGAIGPAGGAIGAVGVYESPAGGAIGPAGGAIGPAGGAIGPAGGAIGPAGGAIGPAGGAIGATSLALQQTFMGISQQQGAVTKTVTADSFNKSGYFYAAVYGLHGAFSPTAFTITVTTTGTSCGASLNLDTTVPTKTFPVTVATGGGTLSGQSVGTTYSTVILTDSQTMPTVKTTPSFAKEITALASATATTKRVVVDVAKNATVRALTTQAELDHACPYAVNLEADAIQNIVNSYRKPTTSGTSLKYVVIVGGDTVIPFFRYADQEVVGPESQFAGQVPLQTTTQLEAALQADYYLTDDPYGAAATVPIDGSTLPLQTAAVGRLVQTPTEIKATIARFVTTAATGKAVKVARSLSAGYTFMAPPATTIAKTFATEHVTGTSNAQLITTSHVKPTVVGNPPAASWTATQLLTKLTSTSHQLVYIGAHFNAKVLLAADHGTKKSTYLTTTTFSKAIGTNLSGALVFSGGCHSGYSVDPHQPISGSTIAWPEAFTQAGATLIAGSGYQYSDANYVAYSDQLYTVLAKQLDYKQVTGGVHIGTALVHSEWAYLASLESLSGISEKSLLSVTLYGLPMMGIRFPTGPKAATGGGASAIGTSTAKTATGGPGKALGLKEVSLPVTTDIASTLTKSFTTVGTATRGYYEGKTGVTSDPYTPVVPVQTLNVSLPSETLRGVVMLDGSYQDSTGHQPLVGDPAVLTAPTPPTFTSSVYAPGRISNPNYFGTLTDGTGTTLGVTPIQYLATPSDPKMATMRRYSGLTFLLFYSNDSGPAAGAPAPGVGKVTISATGTTVTVTSTVLGNQLAGVQQVWATYTVPGATSQWASHQLTQTPMNPNVWKATFPLTSAARGDFMIQAVNGVGEVTMDTNTGAYFTPNASSKVPFTLTLPKMATGSYGATVSVSATLAPTPPAVGSPAHEPVVFSIGTEQTVAYTNTTGKATAHVSLSGLAPGTYPMSASFAGNSGADPAYATGSTFGVTAVTPSLSVTAPTTLQSGRPNTVSAKLTAGTSPLGQESVFFTLTGPKGAVVASSVDTTTSQGIAQAGTLTLPAGDVGPAYTVHAYFATPETPTIAGTVDESVIGYTSASATSGHLTTVSDPTKMSLDSNPSPASIGHVVTLTATVAPTGTTSTSWPTTAGTVHPTGKITFKNGSNILGQGTLVFDQTTGGVTAAISVKSLSVGTNDLSATYGGNTYLLKSSVTTVERVGYTYTIAGTHGALTITKNQVVLVTGTVTGPVTVKPGGGLEVEGGTVNGPVTATGAVGFTLCSATVDGPVSVSKSVGFVLIGGGSGTGCSTAASTTITGPLKLSNNSAGVEVATSDVTGPVRLSHNSGGVVLETSNVTGPVSASDNTVETAIAGNTITGPLSCSGNTPAPTDLGEPNRTQHRGGQTCAASTF